MAYFVIGFRASPKEKKLSFSQTSPKSSLGAACAVVTKGRRRKKWAFQPLFHGIFESRASNPRDRRSIRPTLRPDSDDGEKTSVDRATGDPGDRAVSDARGWGADVRRRERHATRPRVVLGVDLGAAHLGFLPLILLKMFLVCRLVIWA
ncbi:uncharacterized protein [Gossypium hirsutum]|uniref:Uncharacterized protein n=1 Tax=Gossypium hirsutum TaxID=3635 RepID=A0ABM3A259_GOSHI|nr:uncharacterized protein LOC121217131 [Gossypium hirsutum]